MTQKSPPAAAAARRRAALLWGLCALAVALLVRITAGGPDYALRLYGAGVLTPPLWLAGLLWFGGVFLQGAAAGYLSGDTGGGSLREASFWRGCTCLLLALLWALLWYALLFGKGLLLLSWLCLPIGVAAAVGCGLSWWPLSRGGALVVFGYGGWLLLLFLWELGLMLSR